MYNQRDILLIPIPFTNLSTHKRRPVVIISNDNYNKTNPDIVVVAITSNIAFNNEFCIDINSTNLESGDLPYKSKIRCDKIYTLSQNIIVKKFNKINYDTFEQINHKIKTLLRKDNIDN